MLPVAGMLQLSMEQWQHGDWQERTEENSESAVSSSMNLRLHHEIATLTFRRRASSV